MISSALAVHQSIRSNLVSENAILALVPAANIVDPNGRPATFPAIILGDDQVVDETRDLSAKFITEMVFATLHVWAKEPGSETVKRIAGAIKRSLHHQRFFEVDGTLQIHTFVEASRFIRDPDGETAHGIVTVRARVMWENHPATRVSP